MRTVARFRPDTYPANTRMRRVTMGTAGTVTTVELPDAARGMRLYPTGDVRFAVNEDPASTVPTDSFGVGNVARGGELEIRVLPLSEGRTLRLRAEAAGITVDVEVF